MKWLFGSNRFTVEKNKITLRTGRSNIIDEVSGRVYSYKRVIMDALNHMRVKDKDAKFYSYTEGSSGTVRTDHGYVKIFRGQELHVIEVTGLLNEFKNIFSSDTQDSVQKAELRKAIELYMAGYMNLEDVGVLYLRNTGELGKDKVFDMKAYFRYDDKQAESIIELGELIKKIEDLKPQSTNIIFSKFINAYEELERDVVKCKTIKETMKDDFQEKGSRNNR